MLASGYDFAFFDNLNRFYVAREHAGLKARFPAEPAAWDHVQHLWDEGRAVTNAAHGDHALARAIVHGVMAMLPSLPPQTLRSIVEHGLEGTGQGAFASPAAMTALFGTTEHPGAATTAADLDAVLACDRFRAALGRIACAYDGGHIME